MKYISTLDWLEAHLQNSLSASERKELEKKLATDKAFKEEFATYLAVRQAVVEEERPALRTRYFNKKKGKVIFYRKLAAAASVIGLLVVAWFLLRTDSRSPQELYAYYDSQQTINLTDRSGDANLLAQAEKQFEQKNYQAAAQSFNTYLSDFPEDIQILLYKGMALRHIDGQEQAALAIFDQVAENALFRKNANCQKALTYLKLGDARGGNLILHCE